MDIQPFDMLPGKSDIPLSRHEDHVDAWLMSYADLITLLFMFFVIFVSATYIHPGRTVTSMAGDPPHPYIKPQSGLIPMTSPFEDTYRALTGLVDANSVDHDMAVEKMQNGLLVDMASGLIFSPDSADMRLEQLSLLQSFSQAIKAAPQDSVIEIAAYTDDAPLKNNKFANNWELSAMRSARVVQWLIDEGIDPSRLHAASYASAEPVVPNEDERGRVIVQNRERNQRIVLKMTPARTIHEAANVPQEPSEN